MGYIDKSVIRSVIKKNLGSFTDKSFVDELVDYMEKYAKSLTAKALEMTKHSGRKKMTLEDMKLAINLV